VKSLIAFMVIGAACILSSALGNATVIVSQGAGSAVASVDRAVATFDPLTSSANNMNLDTYSEGGLSITTASDGWWTEPALTNLDPFHLPGGHAGGFYAMANGSIDWITIETTNKRPPMGGRQ
jgi:hypothetical protein